MSNVNFIEKDSVYQRYDKSVAFLIFIIIFIK